MIRLKKIYRRLWEADFPWGKFDDPAGKRKPTGKADPWTKRSQPVSTRTSPKGIDDVYNSPAKKLSWGDVTSKFPDFAKYWTSIEHEEVNPDPSDWVFVEKDETLWAEAGPIKDDPVWIWDPKADGGQGELANYSPGEKKVYYDYPPGTWESG